MPTNEFLPFATDVGANVMTQAEYAALTARFAGFIAGTAKSKEANKVFRQSAFMAATVGEFMGHAGYDALDNGDLTSHVARFERSLRDQHLNYVEALGSANALTAAFSPSVTSNKPGMCIRVKVITLNTGPATFDAGPGALPIVTLKGNNLESGDLVPNSIITLIGTGTQWMLAGTAYSEFRFRLKSDLDLYCRPDGNDNNDGLSNTPSGAFREPQAALQSLYVKYDASGRTVTIHLADGSYSFINIVGALSCTVRVTGNTATPANVIISGAADPNGNPVGAYYGAQIELAGCTFTGAGRIYAQSHAGISFAGNCRLNNGTGGVAKVIADAGSLIWIGPSVVINVASGNAASLFQITGSSTLLSYASSFYDAGTVTYSSCVVFVGSCSSANLTGIWGGSPTGQRYQVRAGYLYVAGGGANYIPGTSAGISDETWMYQ